MITLFLIKVRRRECIACKIVQLTLILSGPMGDLSSYWHQIVATVVVVKNYSQLPHHKHLVGARLPTIPVATYTFLVICK